MILLPLNTTDPRYEERRCGTDRRQTVDRRGAYTVEVDGKVVIRPRSDADTADMLEQYVALHEHSRDSQIAERVAKARVLLNEIDSDRAQALIAEFRHLLKAKMV